MIVNYEKRTSAARLWRSIAPRGQEYFRVVGEADTTMQAAGAKTTMRFFPTACLLRFEAARQSTTRVLGDYFFNKMAV
jgi:hypothetical protein